MKTTLQEITADDAGPVSLFLQTYLNRRVPAEAWAALVRPPWGAGEAPNHGFKLVDEQGQIVGVYLAVYSTGDESRPAVCNLAAFCVVEEHRLQALRLVRALLRQKGYVFTDLSPSGNVPAMNERLGFRRLDTATRLVVNLPRLPGRVRATDSPTELEQTLVGRDAIVFRDHRRAAAARHLLLVHDDRYAYLMYRRDRRKRLPIFASPLYVGGDRALLESSWANVRSHLLGRGFLATLAERRVLGFSPGGPGRDLARPRVKMYRNPAGDEHPIDYLYSELTLLQW